MLAVKPDSTSAAATAFCSAKIWGPGGYIWIDGNGKITASNGTLDDPKPNAFSLVQISDCPGATASCKIGCYVHGLEKHAPETHALYVHNSREIRRILSSEQAGEWADLLGSWINENCKGGFRWHVSGDIFSDRYARWIAAACAGSPDVNHWIYTRSFASVRFLLSSPNLTVNLSCDRDNIDEASGLAKFYGLRLCYLSTDGYVPDDLRDGDVIFPDYGLRGGTEAGAAWFNDLSPTYKRFVCPVDYHGKSERRRCGPCDRCLVR